MHKTHERLNSDRIQAALPFGKLSYFDSIDSTNKWLLDNGDCGDVCISEQQTAGKGRRGNSWESSHSGNIYFSLCWCYDNTIKHQSLLGLVVGIAVAESLQFSGIDGHGVKWPNDIFHTYKKLGGILLETVGNSGKVIIGIGINVNLPPSVQKNIDQDATCINNILEENSFLREDLIIALARNLHQHLASFANLDLESFVRKWEKWDILQGQLISFKHQNQIIIGKVKGIDKHGRLGVESENNGLSFYSSADIKIRKAP